MHLLDLANIMLNSLLHFRHELSGSLGDGGTPLSNGKPRLTSAISRDLRSGSLECANGGKMVGASKKDSVYSVSKSSKEFAR